MGDIVIVPYIFYFANKCAYCVIIHATYDDSIIMTVTILLASYPLSNDQSTYKVWNQSDKDALSYFHNEEVSTDAAADVA